jgi:MYXO-CTERM domain-containing protein
VNPSGGAGGVGAGATGGGGSGAGGGGNAGGSSGGGGGTHASGDSEDDGGCGCRTSERGTSHLGLVTLALGIVLALRRRRSV